MPSHPSRRGLLAACGVALGAAFAGCTAPRSDGGGNDADPGASSEHTTTNAGTGGVDATVGAESSYGENVSLTVALRRGGETLETETKTLLSQTIMGMDIAATEPGTYTVTASVDDGSEAATEWTVTESYDGRLDVYVGEDGTVSFREHRSADRCGGEDLPYAVPGNEETFTPGSGSVVNDSGDAVTVTVSVAHEDTTFFECTRTLDANQSASLGDLTETAGEYAVTVAVEGGGRTTRDWRIPPEDNWPRLRVVLSESGDPLVGCGAGGSVDATISNDGGESQSVQLVLRRDGTRITDETATVAAGEESTVALDVPIGGVYTLHATTDAGESTTEVVYCYCYGDRRLTVTLYGGGVVLDSERLVCE